MVIQRRHLPHIQSDEYKFVGEWKPESKLAKTMKIRQTDAERDAEIGGYSIPRIRVVEKDGGVVGEEVS